MRVLLAVDGSSSSITARDFVANHAWPADTVVRALAVSDPPIGWVEGAGTAIVEAAREHLESELAEAAKPLLERGLTVEDAVITGRPATTILEEAARLAADLVVVGSRGHGPIASMVLGSVSAEVADQAATSVLIARRDTTQRVLIATDGSDAAYAIADLVASWGLVDAAKVEIVSVAPLGDRMRDLMVDAATFGADRVADERERLLDRHRGYAEELARRLGDHGLEASASVLAGDPAHEIVEAARQRDTDLVITGTRGLHGIDRLILGSVARNVAMHAPCSVLVARPAG